MTREIASSIASLRIKPKKSSLGNYHKIGGIKINSSINKVVQNKARKSKSAKTNKVMVSDFVTKLASDLTNPTEELGLDKRDPCDGQEEMDEHLSQ